jgi:hypothetical protein
MVRRMEGGRLIKGSSAPSDWRVTLRQIPRPEGSGYSYRGRKVRGSVAIGGARTQEEVVLRLYSRPPATGVEGGAIDEDRYNFTPTPVLMRRHASWQRDEIRPQRCGDPAKPCDHRGASCLCECVADRVTVMSRFQNEVKAFA